jgi:hypothetical protein
LPNLLNSLSTAVDLKLRPPSSELSLIINICTTNASKQVLKLMKILRLIITFHKGHYLPGIVTKDDDLACRELHKDFASQAVSKSFVKYFEAKN